MGHRWPDGFSERQSIAQKKRFKTEVIWNKAKYKNGKIGYHTLHKWIANQRGRPKKCDFCGTTTAKRFEWANKSHLYKQELDDWYRLCSKCHMTYDGTINNLKYYGKTN